MPGRNIGRVRPVSLGTQRPRYEAPLVGKVTPVQPGTANPFLPAAPVNPSGGQEASSQKPQWRLVYLDDERAAKCVERLAASSHGRELMKPFATTKPNGTVDSYNAVVLTTQFASTTSSGAAIDLASGARVELSTPAMHPAQIVAVRGRVRSGTDVLPGSILLSTADGDVRVLVDRAHGLHLNQRYLTERELTAITTVQSVPRRQMRCIALLVRDEG